MEDQLQLLISAKEIQEKIKQIAKTLRLEYKDQEITLVCVLKGAICFTSDLLKELKDPVSLEFIQASSFSNNQRSDAFSMSLLLEENFKDKHILIVDEIFDSGQTLTRVHYEINKMHPKSIKSIVLVKKKASLIEDVYLPTYHLFEIEDLFVVGYGLDYHQNYRGLKDISVVKE